MPAPPDRLRQLHTLTGVFPLGIFVLGHLITQARVLRGASAYELGQMALTSLPGWRAIELVVLASLVVHGGLGLRLAVSGRPRSPWYAGRTELHSLQRVTGPIVLVFVVWHVATLWVPHASGALGTGMLRPSMIALLSSTWVGVPLAALGYLVGVAACSFHFANGMASFAASAGWFATERARRGASWGAALVGLVVVVLGAETVVALATGAPHFAH